MPVQKLMLLLCLAFGSARGAAQTFQLLIGTYTTGKSEGIYVYQFDARTGTLTYRNKAVVPDNPTFLAVSADRRHVYSVHTVGGEKGGGLSSFSFEPASGSLRFLNRVPSGGDRPVYVAVGKDKKHVFAANYAGGSFSAVALRADGSLGEAAQVVTHSGSGPNKDRQEKSHVHMTLLSPDDRFLMVTDLGNDQIEVYRYLKDKKAPLTLMDSLRAPPGSGPRHMTFHPGGGFAYALFELSGTIGVFRYRKGVLKPGQFYHPDSSSPGEFSAADIRVSPDGRFLYASYRAELNELAIYAIDAATGSLSFVGKQKTLGRGPRNFVIDPTGNYVLVAHQNSDEVIVFRRNKQTGWLDTLPVQKVDVGNPSCLVLIPAH